MEASHHQMRLSFFAHLTEWSESQVEWLHYFIIDISTIDQATTFVKEELILLKRAV